MICLLHLPSFRRFPFPTWLDQLEPDPTAFLVETYPLASEIARPYILAGEAQAVTTRSIKLDRPDTNVNLDAAFAKHTKVRVLLVSCYHCTVISGCQIHIRISIIESDCIPHCLLSAFPPPPLFLHPAACDWHGPAPAFPSCAHGVSSGPAEATLPYGTHASQPRRGPRLRKQHIRVHQASHADDHYSEWRRSGCGGKYGRCGRSGHRTGRGSARRHSQ